MQLQNLYRSVVMDHAKRKRHYGSLTGEQVVDVFYKNPTCGDVIHLYALIEQNTLKEISFEGEGCYISMAASSMMTEMISGKSLNDIEMLEKNFEALIRHGEAADENIDLGDMQALEGVHQLRARHNCALMPWQALSLLLNTTKKI